ncbi:MAG: hypothetical protein K2X87_20075 [Gemmataceae bacterium]|nr:hypothetical protein [Gemmataceae bacterium]
MNTPNEVRREDLMPVHSRVIWGAVFAGLFVTLTVFLVLGHLGAAVGLSSADQLSGEAIATGAGIWALAAALVAFFCGGCVASRLTAGESRGEAAVYGTILWGLTFFLLLWMTGSVLRTGFTGVIGTANVAATATAAPADWEQAAQRAGLTPDQANRLRAELPSEVRVRAVSAEAAWWSLAGVVVSLAAAVGGAVAGAGPNPSFGGFLFRRTTVAVGHG